MCNVSVASVSACFSPDVPCRLPPQGLPEKLPLALWLLFVLAEQFVHICPIVFIPCQSLSYLVMRQMCLLRNMCVSCTSIFVVFLSVFYSGPGGVARDTRRSAQDCPESRGQEEIKTRSEWQTLFDIWIYLICWIFVQCCLLIITHHWGLTIMFLYVPFWSWISQVQESEQVVLVSFGTRGGLHTHHACIASVSLKNGQRSDYFDHMCIICFDWFCQMSLLSYSTLNEHCSHLFLAFWPVLRVQQICIIAHHIGGCSKRVLFCISLMKDFRKLHWLRIYTRSAPISF